MSIEGWEKEILKPELDLIREFARYGKPSNEWPIYQRSIYDESKKFQINEDPKIPSSEPYQVLHESTLLYTEFNELYAVTCIFGQEYTINLGGPNIDGYIDWLKKNNQSPNSIKAVWEILGVGALNTKLIEAPASMLKTLICKIFFVQRENLLQKVSNVT